MNAPNFACPRCGRIVGYISELAGEIASCPHCAGAFVMPSQTEASRQRARSHATKPRPGRYVSPAVRIRRLRRALGFIALRQSVRSVLDWLHLGNGPGERLCASLVVSTVFFFVALIVAFTMRFETTNGIIFAAATMVVLFGPTLALAAWPADDLLEEYRDRFRMELSEARQTADIERADRAQLAAAARIENERRRMEWDKQPRTEMQPELVNCPFCREQIRAGAAKCKHCGEFLDGRSERNRNRGRSGERSDKKNSQINGIVGLVLSVVIIVACAGLFSSSGSRSTSDPDKWDVMATAHEFVKQRMKSPSTADFGTQDADPCVRNLGSDEYEVVGWVDAQNGFGATVRADFVLKMKYNRDTKRWRLIGEPLIVQR